MTTMTSTKTHDGQAPSGPAVGAATAGRRSLLRRGAVGLGGAALVLGAGLAAAPAQAADTGVSALEQIKTCESGGDYAAVNASSGASGAYQFLDTTWQSLSSSAGYATAADAPESVQDAAALELYQAQGTTPWAASQSCWGGAAETTASSVTSSADQTTTSSTTVSTDPVSTQSVSTAADAAVQTGEAGSGAMPSREGEHAAHEGTGQQPGVQHGSGAQEGGQTAAQPQDRCGQSN